VAIENVLGLQQEEIQVRLSGNRERLGTAAGGNPGKVEWQ